MTDAPTPVRLSEVVDLELLRTDIADGFIAVKSHPISCLHLLNYTNRTQYERHWTPATRACRGLIVDEDPRVGDPVVLARPFAKFGNVGEYGHGAPFGPLPDAPFDVAEKMDGSLAILYPGPDGPAIATRGSFISEQAQAAMSLLAQRHPDFVVPDGVTLLFEYVAPWNRIVVDYGAREDLVLLAGIDVATGADVEVPESMWSGPRAQHTPVLESFEAFCESVRASSAANAEGFVLRFHPEHHDQPSARVKVKYEEYLRLHKLVTGVSTLSIYELLKEGSSLDALLDAVPDEFYDFVTTTANELLAAHARLLDAAHVLADKVRELPRPEAARIITAQRDAVPGLVFAMLDAKDPAPAAWRLLRPEFQTAPTAARVMD
jgi:RNA ligase